jgi:hypothetical protein
MKAVNYISILLLLVLGSCSSGLYTGFEYDDLYYLPSDKPATKVQAPVSKQIAEGDLKAEEYYDNIYAADTLVSDDYSNAINYDDAALNENYGGTEYNYYDNYSYTGRLRRFYGNYFYPYWRDPFYSSYGWPSMNFGYGSPYSFYDPFMYDPFYYDYGYSGYYGGYYPGNYGYYGGYYSPFYSSFYNPYYSSWGYSNAGYGRDYNNSVAYGRRERQSTYSTRWNNSLQPSASSRRDGYLSKGTPADGVRRSPTGSSNALATDTRRTVSTTVNNQQALNAADRKVNQSASKTATTRSTTVSKPEYNTVNRTYTPNYSNPRMSTRPSYNNSRISTESSGSGNYRGSNERTSPSVSAGQSRSVPSYSNSSTYSAPSRRSSSGSYSSGSYGSSSGRSSSSYSSGSSGGGSRSSSYSGGSSSGSSSSSSSSGSSSSSSGGSTSGGRR